MTTRSPLTIINGRTSSFSTTDTIPTTAIADASITYAKIQNVSATDRILGRSSPGAGVIEEIVATAQARALLADATAADQRTTLDVQAAGTTAVYLSTLHIAAIPSPMQFELMSPLTRWQHFTAPSDVTAWFVYVGFTTREVEASFTAVQVLAAGDPVTSHAQGIYSSENAPNKEAQILTLITATASLDSDESVTGTMRNSSEYGIHIPIGTHVWAAFGTKNAGLKPTFVGLSYDFEEGQVLFIDGDYDLPGLPTVTTALVVASNSAAVPDIRLELRVF